MGSYLRVTPAGITTQLKYPVDSAPIVKGMGILQMLVESLLQTLLMLQITSLETLQLLNSKPYHLNDVYFLFNSMYCTFDSNNKYKYYYNICVHTCLNVN